MKKLMRKLFDKIEERIFGLKLAVADFVSEERGDTNFISIAIILVIVMALAITFIAFKDQIMSGVETQWEKLKTALGIGN